GLLQAGERLFAERGLKKVTVRELCQAARANVAAVNYHFGDKLGLYREVLQGAIAAMRETTEMVRRAGEGQPPGEQLRRFVRIFLQRVLAPESKAVHRLISREVSDPTPALDALVEQGVRPRLDYLRTVIADLMGCEPGDPRVLRCAGSVQSQSVSYFPNPIAVRLGFKFDPTPANIDEIAEHIATFSIGGVHAIGGGHLPRRHGRRRMSRGPQRSPSGGRYRRPRE